MLFKHGLIIVVLLVIVTGIFLVFDIGRRGNDQPATEAPVSVEPEKVCRPTGCSKEICSNEEISSICIFKPEYACYQNAKCEWHKATKQCGWTETAELQSCLDAKRAR